MPKFQVISMSLVTYSFERYNNEVLSLSSSVNVSEFANYLSQIHLQDCCFDWQFYSPFRKVERHKCKWDFHQSTVFLFKTEHLHCDVEKEKHTCYCCTLMLKTCLYKWYCTTILGEKATKANWNSQWWPTVMDRIREEENISVKYNWNGATAK